MVRKEEIEIINKKLLDKFNPDSTLFNKENNIVKVIKENFETIINKKENLINPSNPYQKKRKKRGKNNNNNN